jgi:hypothetical protein
MADDARPKMETGSKRTVGMGLPSRWFAPARLWNIIPDVSLRTGTGLATLAVAALVGAATSLTALSMATRPDGVPSLAAYIFSLCSPSLDDASRAEAPFLEENRETMAIMMAGMDIRPSGNVDSDFVHMMVPHHQGAIDMAKAVLRYGHNEKIRRLAQEITVTQQQEIAVMRLAVEEPLPPSIP